MEWIDLTEFLLSHSKEYEEINLDELKVPESLGDAEQLSCEKISTACALCEKDGKTTAAAKFCIECGKGLCEEHLKVSMCYIVCVTLRFKSIF